MYAIQHEGRTFTPDGIAPAISDVEAHNAAIEAAELADWAKQPDRFAAYVSGRDVILWRGVRIGGIAKRSTYRNNMGARIECVTVKGTNGATYSGRYGSDWSQLVRLRKTKG